MIVFPNAKINIGLNVVKRRSDGYHEIVTCFVPVPWKEVLEIVESDRLSFTATGIDIPGEGKNIVLKAYKLLQKRFLLPPVIIHLHKNIPVGAGLGGGSADGAFTLKLLNELFCLDMSDEQLMTDAATLGADCAFFIKNTPMLARGIGDMLTPVDLSLGGYHIVIVYPGIHISTAEAYSKVKPKGPSWDLGDILSAKSMEDWRGLVVNDFEMPLFERYPLLGDIKKRLYDEGAVYAAMSGSGSCIYGFFKGKTEISFPENFRVFSSRI